MTDVTSTVPDPSIVKTFVTDSKDGYAVYSSDDRLVYCNAAYADFYRTVIENLLHTTFEELIRYCHKHKIGCKIDSPDVESFLQYIKSVRRVRPFRHFEVDFHDGRWFLISEQLNSDKELMVQMKDITKQKLSLEKLENSVKTLSEIALTDDLTDIANRRGFIQAVERELVRCQRHQSQASLALLDVDLFKPINDHHGHQVGDQVLIHLAKHVSGLLRPYDEFGRIGGDEFAIFLSDTHAEPAFDVCDRIRKSVETTPIRINGEHISISLSIGLVSLNFDSSFEQLFEAADNALYQAKANNRNCVVMS